MHPFQPRNDLVETLRKCLAVEIKLDIAKTLRHHPHLSNEQSAEAFESLANDDTVAELIRDLAREEVESAIDRGDLPPAAIIHLAGYLQNPIAEG